MRIAYPRAFIITVLACIAFGSSASVVAEESTEPITVMTYQVTDGLHGMGPMDGLTARVTVRNTSEDDVSCWLGTLVASDGRGTERFARLYGLGGALPAGETTEVLIYIISEPEEVSELDDAISGVPLKKLRLELRDTQVSSADICDLSYPSGEGAPERFAAEEVFNPPLIDQMMGANTGIKRCYRDGVMPDGAPSKQWTKFSVDPDGRIIKAGFATEILQGTSLEECLIEALAPVRFPPFAGETSKTVKYPFIIR